MKILVLDNYDSFTYNLVHYLEELCKHKVDVYRNDEISLEKVGEYDKILLSPGPGLPKDAGILEALIEKYASTKSIFGVCLGMQAIGEVFGGKLSNLSNVYHGVATKIEITDTKDAIFTGLKPQIEVGRYHSWVVAEQGLPTTLKISSKDHNGQIMSLYHSEYDIRGVQFHPESILTEDGKAMLKNWLDLPVKQQANTSKTQSPKKKKSLRTTLEFLHEGMLLNYSEARERLTEISSGMYSSEELREFISAYTMRDITADELTGFRDALYHLAIKPQLDNSEKIDLCGTGGDGKSTFNISTLASFVVAGAGYKVAKHGNYGASSKSGSSNVLEYLGASFGTDNSLLNKQLEASNFTYLHAPLFHPALRHVAPIRKQLGVKTFFNMLGPLLNPASPQKQFTGVYSPQVAELYRQHFAATDTDYIIVHSNDGYDELSLTADALCYSNVLSEQTLSSGMFGLKTPYSPAQLVGGADMKETAAIFTAVLQNSATDAQKHVVIANAALAIHCFEPQHSISDCMSKAEQSLSSGKALAAFKKYIAQS